MVGQAPGRHIRAAQFRSGRVRRNEQSLAEIFRGPLIIALFTVFGLLSALMGDRVWDVGSWVLLSTPIAAALSLWSKRQR